MIGASVLISGMGIAGPSLAYWLARRGFTPTLIERAAHVRRGGYIIDFWGSGYDVAERMGLLPEVLAAGYRMREVRIVDARGRRRGGFDAEVFRKATLGRFTSLPRGELGAILARAIESRVEMIFDESITGIEQLGDGVHVELEHAPPRRFDLVIGADGLHSVVRHLAFGPEERFERFLGYAVAAFEVEGYRPRDEDVYVTYSEPGREVMRFAMTGDRTMFLIVVTEDDPRRVVDRGYFLERCAGMGWECPAILDAMADREIYFDRVSQIRMDRWSTGRVALVGDAAYAPSLLAGQGSALAMVGAYVLAGELARAARPEDAFARYEQLLHRFITDKQDAAIRFAGSFAPRTRRGIWLRNHITRLLRVPFLARLAIGSALVDTIALPQYDAVAPAGWAGGARTAGRDEPPRRGHETVR
jgi:2-polyprenyl-6-methoxyphenol hydroxylase-like FAD-dependent oxidoreductase